MNDQERLLLHKKWTGQISAPELSRLEALLSSDPAFRKEAADLESIWAKAETQKLDLGGYVPDLEKGWTRFRKEMNAPALSPARPAPRVLPLFSIGRVAAAIALLILSYLAVQNIRSGSDPYAGLKQIAPHHSSVLGGFELPDGSIVWINSKSDFWYPKSFKRGERRVILEGEAHFQVTKDPDKPFIVQTPAGEVRVIGTSFNVKAPPSGEYEEVFVESGIVGYKPLNSEEERILKKGESARLKKSTLQFADAGGLSSDAVQWKMLALNFRDTPLRDILDALERSYSMRFDRSQVQKLLDCKVTISFEGADEETVVRFLEERTGMNIRLDRQTFRYRLSGGTCDR